MLATERTLFKIPKEQAVMLNWKADVYHSRTQNKDHKTPRSSFHHYCFLTQT